MNYFKKLTDDQLKDLTNYIGTSDGHMKNLKNGCKFVSLDRALKIIEWAEVNTPEIVPIAQDFKKPNKESEQSNDK